MGKPDAEKERQLGLAIALAAEVHKNQLDKGGVCYMLHPLSVMLMDTGTEGDRDEMIVRVLHDAVEDEHDLIKRSSLLARIMNNFPLFILDAIEALTHRPKGEETYEEYIERVAKNALARQAKIRDLRHNMSPIRLPLGDITGKDYERWNKYRIAYVKLERYECE